MYCLEQKGIADEGGPTPASALGRIHEQMADEAVDVMTSYCAEERICALNGLASASQDENVRRSAATRAGQIEMSKSFFVQSREL